MKQIIASLALLVIISCQGAKYQWYSGTFEEAKAIADSKVIMIKFYTNT
jgi:hypothetical protein